MLIAPNTLAYIVPPWALPRYIGRVVHVLRRGAADEIVHTRGGDRFINAPEIGWLCDASGEDFPVFIAQACLRPISGPAIERWIVESERKTAREGVPHGLTRMRTLNGAQSAAGKEMHLCPMQFDIADRVIERFTMPGEVVLDPFGGLMTVPYRAILAKRRAIGIELSPAYFTDGANYCKAAEQEVSMPTLFDLAEEPNPTKEHQ